MFKELLLGSTILTNYARVLYDAQRAELHDVGPSLVGGIVQASVGSAGTISSDGLLAQLPMQTPPVAGHAASCNTTPTLITTTGTGTIAASTWPGCSSITVEAIGAGGCPKQNRSHAADGGGYGSRAGITLSPGQQFAYQVGDGSWASTCGAYAKEPGNTFFCTTTTNCGYLADTGVTVGGLGGYSLYGGVGSNIGSTVHNAGTGGADFNSFKRGGAGGAAGSHGNGGNGGNATTSLSGAGGQGDNGSGGAGGAGVSVAGVGNPGTAGTGWCGNAGGPGGGGSGAFGTSDHTGGAGGNFGGGAGSGQSPADGAKGAICVTPAP